MTLGLIVGLAALTYLSRVAALVLLPAPSPSFEAVLRRVPAPLFAGFAAISLVSPDRAVAPAETLVAVTVAVACSRSRSMMIILTAGLGGYAVVELLSTWAA